MSEVIGQKNILNIVDEWVNSNRLPRFIIITGPTGHGKKTIANYMAKRKRIEVVEYGLKVDDVRNMIENSTALYEPRISLFLNAHDMTVQAQNALLKTLEEPPRYAHIILTVVNTENILPTIYSRSHVLRLEPYKQTELKTFTNNERILDVCDNPGQVLNLVKKFDRLYPVCEKIVNMISQARLVNVFNILNYFSEEDYLDVTMLLISLFKNKMQTSGQTYQNQLYAMYKYTNSLRNKTLNKRIIMELMLIDLREAYTHGTGPT